MTTVEASPAQAGGGAPEKTTAEASQTFKLEDSLRSVIKREHDTLSKEHDLKTAGGFDDFLVNIQGTEASITGDDARKAEIDGCQKFESWLAGEHGNALQPLEPQDLQYTLNNYFISSSHNTYLSGNQLTSDSSTDGYKNVLLRGCRCVEIDVWDGEEPSDSESEAPKAQGNGKEKKGLRSRLMGKLKRTATNRLSRSLSPKSSGTSPKSTSQSPEKKSPEKKDDKGPVEPGKQTELVTRTRTDSSRAEPRVLHGYTATKEITFKAVCETIRDYAFVTSDLPVIVSLEVHTGIQQQEIMVEMMQEAWKGMLVEHNDPHKVDLQLPTVEQLKKKLLIKVKYSPPKPPKEPSKQEKVPEKKKEETSSSSSSSSSSEDENPGSDEKKPEKPSKILGALSRLGIYTRSYHFGGFDAPEAQVPTHVFSLSEGKLMETHETQSDKLFKHNKSFLMRTYPKGLRISSSNLDPTISWRKGVQICALNWQRWDEGTMLNEGMFAGSSGYILKPHGFFGGQPGEPSSETPVKGKLDLQIKFLGGQNIPLPPDDDNAKGFKPYVKCELHVEKHEEGKGHENELKLKHHTKTAHGTSPDFGGDSINFEHIASVTPELSFVRFKVKDDEPLRDDLAAWACFRLDRLRTSYRFIHLFNAHGEQTDGVLFVHITKTFTPGSA